MKRLRTLKNYQETYKTESIGQSREYKSGLILGILGSTNNKKIRRWAENQKKGLK